AEHRIGPARSAVIAHLDALDRARPGPGPALEWASAGLDEAFPGHELGDPRREHETSNVDASDGLAGFVLGGTHPITAHVLVALERLGEDRDPPQPLHVGHAVPSRHDQAKGRAVLWQ